LTDDLKIRTLRKNAESEEVCMKRGGTRVWQFIQVTLFLLFFGGTVAVNLTCAEDDNPSAGSECGSGRGTWDSKAQVCRDLQDNRIIPNKCCGH
jgi:hypothetical protein